MNNSEIEKIIDEFESNFPTKEHVFIAVPVDKKGWDFTRYFEEKLKELIIALIEVDRCVCDNPDCKICVDKEIKRVDSLMPRAGICNKCVGLLVVSIHCRGLEMGCACECKPNKKRQNNKPAPKKAKRNAIWGRNLALQEVRARLEGIKKNK